MSFVILVTGDRHWQMDDDNQGGTVQAALHGYRSHNPVIVHGAARGVDSIADYYAQVYGYEVHPHPANWDMYHRAAGPIRNTEMLSENPNLVLAFHDDIVNSKGTKNMVNQAITKGIPTILHFSNGKRTVLTKKV
jgi:hypothetical protein